MTNTRDIILKLKQVRAEKNLSYSDILELMEKNNDFLSKSTISRVFADGSEDATFRYDETIRPIAKALLDIENIEDNDDMDIQAMKTLLKYKIQRIEELEQEIEHLKAQNDREKLKYHEKMDKERTQFQKSIDFLKDQISKKDLRIDLLLQSVQDKDSRYNEVLNLILTCPCRKKAEKE